jgi:hypothetical protein
MLGKHAWKMFTDPRALITRLFKAKHFPNCDFIDSSISYNPSCAWRSIWSAKFVIKGGYSCGVSDLGTQFQFGIRIGHTIDKFCPRG